MAFGVWDDEFTFRMAMLWFRASGLCKTYLKDRGQF